MSRVVLGFVALTLLSACGIRGDLERPDPLWNREEAIRRECAEQAARNQPQDPRCAQYQTGVEPQASLAPAHQVVLANVEQVNEISPPLPSRTAIPEIIEAPADQ